jgi:diguanylate cyclase (GGDEF)-like protein
MIHSHVQEHPDILEEPRTLFLDALTGLPGRDALLAHIEQHEAHTNTGLLCIDMDQLAALNEAMGLTAGDMLLAEAARRIALHAGNTHFLVRYGGDEFAMLMPSVESAAAIERKASDVLDALRRPYLIAGREVFVGASIGIAFASTPLLQHAETALARAKISARGSWCMYSPGIARARCERFHLKTELGQALEQAQFEVYYQPKASCRSGAVTGFEALIRWNHPQRGLIAPSEFIPALEESGLIERVGAWVLKESCMQLKRWDAMGHSTLQIAVNVSLRQLADPAFAELVGNTLSETHLAPQRLELELTESMLMHDSVSAEALLRRLKALGIRLAIDDFGTGYSSLAYLKRLPIDTIKIDRAFVQDITTDPNDASITRAIVGMAHSLKMAVVAEGVETEAQLSTLVAEQCESVQGYYIGKPMSADNALAFLATGWHIAPEILGRPAKARTLLLVDDEESIVLALKRLLRREGYRILSASSGAEGLDLLAKNDVDVIVSDQRMPHMTGEEFLRRTKELYPDTVRMVLSGYADMQSITNAINRGAIYKFLSKPWDDQSLKEHIQEAFRRKELSDESRRLVNDIAVANTDLNRSNQSLASLLDEQSHSAMIGHAALAMAQETLHLLPAPVLGLDPQGMVVLRNESFFELHLAQDAYATLAAGCPPWQHTASFFLEITDQEQQHWNIAGRHLVTGNQHRGTVFVFLQQACHHA